MHDPSRFDLLHIHPEDSEWESAEEASGTEVVVSPLTAEGGSSGGPRMPMLVSVAGHTDAGSLSEQLADSLLGSLPHRQVASFDIDELFDYRSRRPQVTFTENRFSDYRGPKLDLFEVRDAMDRPFLLLTGDEPDFQWERVSRTVLQLIEELDVKLLVTVDSLGLPTPHTRPVGVTAHGNRKDLIDGISTWAPSAQIEAGLSQMLELRADEAGRDVVGYTLHVPHYLAGGRYPQVAVAALEYAGAACEMMLPSDELREAARTVEADVSRQVEQAPEIAQLVKQLESNFDQHASPAQRSLLLREGESVPDAEELGAAVEEFLRSQPED
ncbi:PAC2 family protein [Nesterenkonia muleiensis]|uniref:PAC2 family protein n=1 Tax=Nesterenkonia muleiensis TaxID=2282648 RepID=UPI000E72F8A2|nr:PAC2 family protein [Nesterenkonia muleiensis]